MEAPNHASPEPEEATPSFKPLVITVSPVVRLHTREKSALWTPRVETEDVQRCNAVGKEAGLVCFWLLLRIIAAFAGRDT